MPIFLNQSHIDKILELLDEKDEINRQIREILAVVFQKPHPESTSKSAPARQRKAEKASKSAMPVSVKVSGIKWLTRDKKPASPDAAWSWAYGYDREGFIRPETEALIQEILKYGKVTVGGFEFSLSGRDMNLLSRKKV